MGNNGSVNWAMTSNVSNYSPKRRAEDLRRLVDLHICTQVSIGPL